jgi:hypothetical protein
MFVDDLELAQELWAEVLPLAASMALNNEEWARIILSHISRVGSGGKDDVSRKVKLIDEYMAAYIASDSQATRNYSRMQRASIRVASMKHAGVAERNAMREEVASLLVAAEQDGLLEVGVDLARMLLGFGIVAAHGFPEPGGKAWMPRSDDPAWWRRPAETTGTPWSVFVFTGSECPFCEPYWKDLLRAVEACEHSRAPRIIAVVASDTIPKYLRESGPWGIYRNYVARESWLTGWGVYAIPTAFIVDGNGHFSTLFLRRDDIAAAIAGAKSQ